VQQHHRVHRQGEGAGQEQPGEQLQAGERLHEPSAGIEQNESQHTLKGAKPEEAVAIPSPQREEQQQRQEGQEDRQLDGQGNCRICAMRQYSECGEGYQVGVFRTKWLVAWRWANHCANVASINSVGISDPESGRCGLKHLRAPWSRRPTYPASRHKRLPVLWPLTGIAPSTSVTSARESDRAPSVGPYLGCQLPAAFRCRVR